MKVQEAAERCHVRGYIAPVKYPDKKIWKNSMDFNERVERLIAFGDPSEEWEHYDSDGEYLSIRA